MTDLTSMRISYTRGSLGKNQLDPSPLRQFEAWFAEALAADLPEPYAMSLATVSATGQPSVRIVLLRKAEERGLIFYSNYDSHKGQNLSQQPQAEVLFYWAELERQVRVRGNVERLSKPESAEYFVLRPRDSQLAAHISTPQSGEVASRAALEQRYAAIRERYEGQKVPIPDFWGGYLLRPVAWEFWQGRPNRLHDRLEYRNDQRGNWQIRRLMP